MAAVAPMTPVAPTVGERLPEEPAVAVLTEISKAAPVVAAPVADALIVTSREVLAVAVAADRGVVVPQEAQLQSQAQS